MGNSPHDFYRVVNAVLLAGFSTAAADTLCGMLKRVTDNANAAPAKSQT